MTTSSLSQNQPVPATNEALMKADQLAWEAPALRSTFTSEGGREDWAHPCPPWCTGEGESHRAESLPYRAREHESAPLRVRQDGAFGYECDDEEHPIGVHSAHLAVSLVASGRHLEPRLRIVANSGATDRSGAHRRYGLAPLYADEVRELIAVLQHMLKVGLEGEL